MNNKLPYIIGGGIVLLLVGILFSTNQKGAPSQNTKSVSILSPQASGNTTASQDPQDVVPGLYKNLIQNNATTEGFTIVTTSVENNTDAGGKSVGDHLELTLKNTSGKDLTDVEVYYTISDPTTNKKEGYFKKLTGFVLKGGATQQVHFDNKQGDGHFPANTNSIYYTSSNKLFFDVMVSAPGYKVQTSQAEKAAGGAETKD